MTLEDKEIQKQIMDDLYWDSSIDSSKITVSVEDGVVMLGGEASSYTDRLRAEEAACRIKDVVRVENTIGVRYVPSLLSDGDIRESVVDGLDADPDMDRTDIRVSVKRGVVTLGGSVDQYWKKGEAERISCRVRGVCDIVDKLTVVPTRSIADKVIAEDVRAALERNFDGTSECVDIRVEDGIVTLSGSIPSWAARRAAINAAEFTRGVCDVFDTLEVTSSGTAGGVC